jgi:hypothetical protein
MILLKKHEVKTMTSDERVAGLHEAIISVHENKIIGDVVECGVYLGGNVIIAKKFFDSVNDFTRNFYAFDTFEGMTEPSHHDSKKAHRWWNTVGSCIASIDEVKKEFTNHLVLDDRVKFVKGDITQTLLNDINVPDKISILRLDTDWYESTKLELEILYKNLVSGGFLIIDDYGYWQGCKKAVDEFFGNDFVENNFKKLDNTGIMFRKP